MAEKRITIKEFLAELIKRSLKIPQLVNFLREHDFVGTTRGVPRWRRNTKFYQRNAKV